MRRDKQGQTTASQIQKQFTEFITRFRIESGSRFVEYDYARRMDDRMRDRDALTQATRQIPCTLIEALCETEIRCCLIYDGFDSVKSS